MSTDENVARVASVFDRLLDAVNADQTVSAQAELVFAVESLMQEVNSGASFEQYFRWVRITQERKILQYLDELGLSEVVAIVERAIAIAFPEGIPEDDDEYDTCTDWTEAQEAALAGLFVEFEPLNGVVTNRLGEFISQQDPEVFRPAERAPDSPGDAVRVMDPQAALADLIQVLDHQELSEVRRIAWLAYRYECSILNGGHWRHFMDSRGYDQDSVIAALHKTGAVEQAELLTRAVTRIPAGLSIASACELRFDDEEISDMADLDAAFRACETPLNDYLCRYVGDHPQEFS